LAQTQPPPGKGLLINDKEVNMKTVSETRKVSNFRRLELCETVNWVDLIAEPGETEQLTIEGPPEYIDRVVSEVQGDTLKVSLSGSLSDKVKDALTTSLTRKMVTYHLTAKNLVEIEVAGLIRVNLDAYGENRPMVKDLLPRPPIQPWPN
jgi:hypothetical protein